MNVNSVEAHTIKAMFVEEKNNQKVEVTMSEQKVVQAKELAMISEVLDHVNNIHSVEGHLQKWRGTAR